jgi:membrane-associated phospholipid phosphatase
VEQSKVTFREIIIHPIKVFYSHFILVIMSALVIAGSSFYPSDMDGYYATSKGGNKNIFVNGIEDYGRHINMITPLVMALVLKDGTGIKQLLVITFSGILASHGPKRLLNDFEVMGTRLGQRPTSPNSKHNTPSGHSTMAGSGAYYLMRRYSWWFGFLVIPVMLFTMYARVMLDQHTISATIAGAATGMLVAALFTTKLKGLAIPFQQT